MGILDYFKLKQPEERTIIVQNSQTGKSGTEIYSGIFDEEYLQELIGTKKAEIFDKIRRGDARAKMCLSAVKNPIRSADWSWHPGSTEEEHKLHAEFLEHVFTSDIGGKKKKKFKRLLTEYLSCVDFGYVVMEKTHKTVLKHPKFGDYVGLRNLAWRSPKTLEYFHVDNEGDLETIEQQAYGDIESNVHMKAKFLSIVSIDQEGDNFEGISMLRPCYGAWLRKQVYLKLMAIGIEKHALGTPSIEVPPGKENSAEFVKAEEILKKLNSHEMNYIMRPKGWEFEYHQNNFDAAKVKDVIDFENQEMVFAFLANFLQLGSGGGGGSFALSNDLSDFFTNGIIYIADMITEELNDIGQELIELNYGPQEYYPKLTHSGITDKVGKEFSEVIKALTDSGHLTPDDTLEDIFRKRLKLTPMREGDARDNKEPEPTEPPKDDKDKKKPDSKEAPEEAPEEVKEEKTEDLEEEEQLSDYQRAFQLVEEKAQQQIKNSKGKILRVMQKHLSTMGKDLVKDIMKNYNTLTEANKIDAINGTELKGRSIYQKELKKVLIEVANDALKQVKKEMPAKVRNLYDPNDSMKLNEFEDLPADIRKLLLLQSRLLVETQGADIKKHVYMEFGSEIFTTEGAAFMEDELNQTVDTYVNGSSVVAAGGNTASRMINESRTAAFFDDKVLEEIESFTFVNADPQAPICKDLAGRTFRKDDPGAKMNFPPLHHNCESYISANFSGAKKNPEIDKRGLKTKFVSGF